MLRELDERSNGGITVSIWWDDSAKNDPKVSEFQVKVSDVKSGELFTISLDTFELARSVFHHPYAYRDSLLKTGKAKVLSGK